MHIVFIRLDREYFG